MLHAGEGEWDTAGSERGPSGPDCMREGEAGEEGSKAVRQCARGRGRGRAEGGPRSQDGKGKGEVGGEGHRVGTQC